ncbi:MAG: glycosyltransferase [Terracidiphilus sp.]
MREGETPVEPLDGNQKKQLSLAILVTNYNTWEIAKRCVDACFQQDRGRFDRLLVYDDCSTEESAGEFPESTQLYKGCPNLGLTKALNVAFGMVKEDIVVLFDSDAYPTTPFCDSVKDLFAEDPQLGLITLRTIGRTGKPTQSFAAEPNVWSLLLGQNLYAKMERWLADRSGRIVVFTCAMAVRKCAFDELRGFDEAFDWIDLDLDFSMRMNRSRWRVEIAPGPRVFHEGGGAPQLTRKRVGRFYKNRWYLLNKFHRIRMKKVVKALILARLYIEYTILRVAGKLLFSDETIRNDKVMGRRELIRFCTDTY